MLSGREKKMKRVWKDIRFLAALSKQICPYYLTSKCLDELLQILTTCIYIFLPKYIIDAMVEGLSWDIVLTKIVIFMASVIVCKIIDISTRTYRTSNINQADIDTVKHYSSLYLEMDYEKFETAEVRNLLETVMGRVRGNTVINFGVSVISACFQIALYSAVIIMLSPVLLAVIVLTMAVRLFVNYRKNGIENDTIQGFKKNTRFFNYIDNVTAGFEYAKEMRTNQADSLMEEKYKNNLKERYELNTAYNKRIFFTNGLESCAGAAELLALYGYGSYKALQGEITVGSFTMYTAMISSFTKAISQLMSCIMDFKLTLSFVEKYHTLIDMMQNDKRKMIKETSDIPEAPYTFEFRDVSFRYPNTEKTVLKDVNLKIAPGEKIAIVGKNGAGKTTLIKLLCGIYVPTDGEILLNGIDIQTFNRKRYAELIAAVFQDYILFAFDIKENIKLNKEENEGKLWEVIEKSGLKEKVENLPDGIHTPVGKQFSRKGVDFSGGEKQKIALARACYKDSPLIIMDEPTASMDPLAELKLYAEFNNIIGNRTAIFISHRLASAKFCDRIIVFEDGEIIETGAHEMLMDAKGRYYEMFHLQTELYA